MQQVLFRIPILTNYFPDGIPVHGFGVMLFLAFIICSWLIGRRSRKLGTKATERIQDMVIFIFISGILGARITFMIQYHVPIVKLFNIWEGGIVFYGSAIGGWCGYWLFYWFVLRKLKISSWQIGDIVAPAIALGLALGRVGCLLNGCCYGQVAVGDLPKLEFPLLTAPVREATVDRGLQTLVGFSLRPNSLLDVRSVVDRVEPDSNAQRAGLKSGDRILRCNGHPNTGQLMVHGDESTIQKVLEWAKKNELEALSAMEGRNSSAKLIVPVIDDLPKWYDQLYKDISERIDIFYSDYFHEQITSPPRGQQGLTLTVLRDSMPIDLPRFVPRSLGLHPTQLYETISMILLFIVLMSYYPLRRHDGQVFVVLMLGYAIHRYLNEVIRNDTSTVGFDMTLSQNGSLFLVIAAVILELWLRYTQVNRWRMKLQEKQGAAVEQNKNGTGAISNLVAPYSPLPSEAASTAIDSVSTNSSPVTERGENSGKESKKASP